MRPDHESPDEPPADIVDHAAAIDDYVGGFTDRPSLEGFAATGVDDEAFASTLDIMLLLRQAAAAAGAECPVASRPPARIGRYEIARMAGRGGFAVVWEAFDPVLRRRVAVKVRRPEAILSPSMQRRFLREAEIASRLVHPHIVTIYEVGEDGGQDFITAEFCEGGSLADWLGRHPGPLAPTKAARLVLTLARAVAHAHEAGIIHRDIKPANVMLVPAGSALGADGLLAEDKASTPTAMTVKLCDFGLGKLHGDAEDRDPLTQLTASGSHLGTPAWMAPEQIDRSFGPVGAATDVHALGLLLDRLLTGRCLRGGRTDAETYREVLLEDPVPANRVVRSVPPDLGAVCVKCLAKRPSARYPTATALADDLARWLDGRPTLARPLSPLGRLAKQIARRPVIATLATAVVIATLAAGWTAQERSREQRKGFIQQEQLRRQNAATELRRGFEALRAGNVTGALDLLAKAQTLDAGVGDSLAARWLRRRTHGEREILLAPPPAREGPHGPLDLHAIAMSPDGRTVAVAGADGDLRLVRHLDGRPAVASIRAHDEINGICFSPDGRLVATAGQDGRVCWWHADDDRGLDDALAGEIPPTGCPLYAVCFAPNGRSILYGGEDRILRAVSLDGRRPLGELHRFPQVADAHPEIEAIVPVGDDMVAVACGDTIALFDASDGRMLRECAGENKKKHPQVLHGLAASADGRRILAGGSGRKPRIYDTATGERVTTLPAHPHWIQGCRFSADGRLVATACRDGIVRLFDANTGSLVHKLVGHVDRTWDVAFESGGTILTAGADGTLRRWDASDRASAPSLRAIEIDCTAIRSVQEFAGRDASPRNSRLVLLQTEGPLQLLDPRDCAREDLAAVDPEGIAMMAVDRPRGRLAVSFFDEHPLPRVVPLPGWNAAAAPGPLVGQGVGGDLLCWTANGRLLAGGSRGLFTWSATLNQAEAILLEEGRPQVLAAAPGHADRVAVGGKAIQIVTLKEPGRQPILAATPLALPDTVCAVAWSPDATTLACGLKNGGVHVFDVATGAIRGTLVPHERQIEELAYSPDGHVLVTADADCLRLSDAVALTTLDEVRPGWRIGSFCIAADGSFIAIAGGEHAVDHDAPPARLAVMEFTRP
jgi:WD40 repeat protein/tRNA A-37 threonylcarbamoyl transferase component Bud32